MGPGKDLKTQVADWLTKQGYPFELQVGRELVGAGWNVQHARFYRDALTGKLRELDIQASRFGEIPQGEVQIALALAVECKRRRDKPWVIFSSPTRAMDLVFPHTVAIGGSASLALMTFASESKHQGRLELLQSGQRRGHGIVQTLGGEYREGKP